MNLKQAGFSTRAIRAGVKENETRAIAPPIYQTAPFSRPAVLMLLSYLYGERCRVFDQSGVAALRKPIKAHGS